MKTRLWIYLALVASFVGCGAAVAAPKSIRLKEDEGVIVYSMKCGRGVAWAQLFRSGANSKGYRAESRRAGMLNCPEGVQLQKLKAGHYFIGKAGFQSVVDFSEEAATQFDVVAGKLNYIGQISLPSSFDKGENLGRVLISDPFVNDRHQDALDWLVANQPSLQQEHEFVAGLAQSPDELMTNALDEHSDSTGLTVVLKLRVGADGSVREGHIAKSSGNVIVDETAVREAVRNWMLTPSVAGETWGNYSVTYRPSN
ncbi:MAG TPA: TonB family protein [Steroidobacter sp.]